MLWKENCCGSSVTCRDSVVVEAVVLCVLCVLVAMCGVVPVRCTVCCCSLSVAVRCCCSGLVVVVGTEGRAGNVGCSSLLPRVVLGEVATVAATTQAVGCLEEVDVDASAIAVVASMAETCLVEDVGAKKVEDPDAKAKAGCC